jgi:hypothetical protein
MWSGVGARTDYSLEYLCNLNHDVNRVLRKGLYADALSIKFRIGSALKKVEKLLAGIECNG